MLYNDSTYVVAPATLYCLRWQGTSPIFLDDFCPAEQKSSRKERKSTALPKAKTTLTGVQQ
jgi:hypothetical protein